MKQTYIFDFNGTLLDDCNLCLEILNTLCKQYHLPPVSMEQYKDIFTFPVSHYYQQLGFKVDEESMKILSKEFHGYYNELSYTHSFLFKNVKQVLDTLSKTSTLVCLSASLYTTLLKQLKYYGIDTYFDYIVGLDDAFARSKIQVAIDFMKENQINPTNTVLIGDSLHDAEVAKEINVNCILVSSGHTSKERLKASNCQIIDDLIEILS